MPITFNNLSPKVLQNKILTFRVPGKAGTTVVGEMIESGPNKDLVSLGYKVVKEGKVLEENSLGNKKGFPINVVEDFSNRVQEKVKEGFNFLKEALGTRERGESMMLEQHIHGAFGVDFNKAEAEEISNVADKLAERGIGAVFPTLVTDSVANIKRQIERIKEAAKVNSRILGIHLEGIFINPKNKGIHNTQHLLEPNVKNFELLEDDFIKIVTLAPELDKGLIDYLRAKGVKVQAGHCSGWGNVDGVTHMFNAMSGVHHRNESTALSALLDKNVYTEVIADGVHVNENSLNLLFMTKPVDKPILVSDALPITHSNQKEAIFADSLIKYDGKRATSEGGTIAGSTMLLDEIVQRLKDINLFKPEYIENAWKYHGLG